MVDEERNWMVVEFFGVIDVDVECVKFYLELFGWDFYVSNKVDLFFFFICY